MNGLNDKKDEKTKQIDTQNHIIKKLKGLFLSFPLSMDA